MKRLTGNLESIAKQIRRNFSAVDKAREKALPLCREVIRLSSDAIRSLHRKEYDKAAELLKTARKLLDEIEQTISGYGELINLGFARDAEKEFAEGSITLALVTGKRIPKPSKLGVEAAAYLNGMGEAVGELRRYLLDSMRRGDLSRCEEILSDMDDIYGILVTMDFPDAITGGLRRTTDVTRGILERTRSDLTVAIRQKELEEMLKSVKIKRVRK
jgi:translin